MLELFSPETTLVVGLDLSDGEQSLIDTAVSLAQRTGARLILVHAVPPFRNYALAGEGFALPYEELQQEAYDSDLKAAEARLETLRDQLPADLVVETEVLREFPEDALEAIAMDSRAQVILCGYRLDKHHSFCGGMSTALSLMRHAHKPVLTIPIGTTLDFLNEKYSILVADNLRTEGLYALKAAMGLCKSIDTDELVHLHVNPSTVSDLQAMVGKVKMAMIQGRYPNDPDFTLDLYVERMNSEILSAMRQRLQEADPEFARDVHYRATMRLGHPSEVVHKMVEETHARILVFGKHHIFRSRGFSLGKIPYQSMVESNVATLVVPDQAEGGEK